jgi:hypothetical protein
MASQYSSQPIVSRALHRVIFEEIDEFKGQLYPNFIDFPSLWQDQVPGHCLSILGLPETQLSISANELPQQYDAVAFNLTHNINFVILPTQKREVVIGWLNIISSV